MPPTTRANARRASGVPTPPQPVPYSVEIIRQRPGPPSSVLGGTMRPEESLVAATSSVQPTNTPTCVSSGRSSATTPPAVIVGSSTEPAAPGSSILGPSMSSDNSLVTANGSNQIGAPRPIPDSTPSLLIDSLNVQNSASSSKASTSSPQALGVTTRSQTNAAREPKNVSHSITMTSIEDINNPITRNQVSSLQQLHPWASIPFCHSTLVRYGCFVDASAGLRRMADDENERTREMSQSKMTTLIQDISKELMADSTLRAMVNTLKLKFPDAPISMCKNSLIRYRGNFDDAASSIASRGFRASELEPLQPLLSSSGIFSRTERQRIIASSTETAVDRERVAFIANAVLYRAFAIQDYNPAASGKNYTPWHGFRTFPKTRGSFEMSSLPPTLSKHLFKGTDRGKFRPLSFETQDDGIYVLQSINLAFPYLKKSVEELRLGDYIRGRKKAPHLFDLFRKLPAEIRCMIWRFSMLARTVELRYNYRVDRCWTVSKAPVALGVCRESRYEALKRYTLSFGIHQAPNKTYFDFKRDTLFLTYEKWHGDGDYEGEIDIVVSFLAHNGDAKRVSSLAMDRDLVEILGRRLEEEEEEWYDEGDQELPKPMLEVIPEFSSLQSFAIVKSSIDGFWDHDGVGCECGLNENCEIKKRAKKNDSAVFEATHPSSVANRTQQEYYKQLVAQIKEQDPDWNVPEVSYMIKRARSGRLVPQPARVHKSCPCGGGCWYDSD